MRTSTSAPKKRILTGDRPTGALHLGHYVGSLRNRVTLQDDYECFFIIADYQVLTDHLYETEKITQNVREIVLDYLSVGIDPKKSAIFIQSMIPEIAELTMYFSMLVSLSRVQRNPTVKDEIQTAKIKKEQVSYGFVGYPISQAADILVVRANLVPVGEDQLPHLEQTREIARTFNRIFGEVFPVPEALLGEFPRLPGIDGQKMSKSRNNAIFLKDSPEEVAKKVMRAYTDPTRIHATDPGHLEGNVVFAYLDAFCQNQEELNELKSRYKKGTIGDVKVKKRLIEILNDFLNPIRKKRKELEANSKLVEEVLTDGIEKTRREAKETLRLVRKAMHLDYSSFSVV
ncbi:MAG: tryptophan--tRNA ligase [Patescibacteria group bacterium]|nr:tryptophan--tRNA ligase [Patescibacteria group bacterium]